MYDKQVYRMQYEFFKALANPMRLMLLDILQEGEQSVSNLLEITGSKKANLSQHLSALRERGLIDARREGRNVHYSVSKPKITRLFDEVHKILVESLEAKSNLLKQLTKTTKE